MCSSDLVIVQMVHGWCCCCGGGVVVVVVIVIAVAGVGVVAHVASQVGVRVVVLVRIWGAVSS